MINLNAEQEDLLLELARELYPECEILKASLVDDHLQMEVRLSGSIKFVQIVGEIVL